MAGNLELISPAVDKEINMQQINNEYAYKLSMKCCHNLEVTCSSIIQNITILL